MKEEILSLIIGLIGGGMVGFNTRNFYGLIGLSLACIALLLIN